MVTISWHKRHDFRYRFAEPPLNKLDGGSVLPRMRDEEVSGSCKADEYRGPLEETFLAQSASFVPKVQQGLLYVQEQAASGMPATARII